LLELAGVLEIPARELARTLRREWHELRRESRGGTLRPGIETPLWLALAAAVRRHLTQPGARAALARELGLHRSRMSEFFFKKTAMPDAERTLLLLLWLAQNARSGRRRQPRGEGSDVRNTNISAGGRAWGRGV
jgi:hypothetical protein